MLTLYAVVCFPNKVKPLAPTWAAIWAGPVSLAITKVLSLTKEVSWEISSAFPLSNKTSAFISFASFISDGPGAITILYSLLNLSKISFIRSL